MSSVCKRPRSPYWVCCYTDGSGRQRKRSTKQRDRSKATEVCLAFQRAEDDGRAGRLTEAHARRVLGEIVERTTGRAMVFFTIGKWIQEWLKGKDQAKSPSTTERYTQVLGAFVDHLGQRANLGLPHLTPGDIRSFRDMLRGGGRSAQTSNQAVKIVGAALNSARRLGYLMSNPTDALESLPEDRAEKKAFTTGQIQAVLGVASEDWQGVIMMGYYTGARLGDLVNMRREHIDLTAGWIDFKPQKTERTKKKARLVIPLHPALAEFLLKKGIPEDSAAPLFPSLVGRSSAGKSGLSMAFARLLGRAEINVGRTERADGMRASSELSFHSLRHSFNSALANSGVSQEFRQKLTGHSTPEMNAVYTHLDVEQLRQAVGNLPLVTPLN